MVIFHGYVSLLEGIWNDDKLQFFFPRPMDQRELDTFSDTIQPALQKIQWRRHNDSEDLVDIFSSTCSKPEVCAGVCTTF